MGKFKRGDKAPKEKAEKALRAHAAVACDNRFTVRFENDDGGANIVLYLEVEEPSESLDPGIREALWEPKWMGWRYIVIKCPPGYIEYILEGNRWQD